MIIENTAHYFRKVRFLSRCSAFGTAPPAAEVLYEIIRDKGKAGRTTVHHDTDPNAMGFTKNTDPK